jgi:hypothetical protein
VSTNTVNVNALPAQTARTCGCGCCDTGGLERVRFFPRQILGADDLNTEQRYFREKQRRHNRYLHGWGVVCGCEVKPSPTQAKPFQVVICPGYVVTPLGDEVMIGTPALFDLATCLVSSDDPCALSVPCPPVTSSTPLRSLIYLAVCYHECITRPVRVAPAGCSCDEVECDYSRICDGYEFSCLSQKPAPESGPTCQQLCDGVILPCPPCPQDNCVILATIRLETKFVPNPGISDAALAAQYLVAQNSPMQIDNLTDRHLLYSTANLQTMALCNCGTQPEQVVDTPVITDLGTGPQLPSGITPVYVEVTVANPAGAQIYYTIDGTNPVPGAANTTLFGANNDNIALNEATLPVTVTAIGVYPGYQDSAVASQVINPP